MLDLDTVEQAIKNFENKGTISSNVSDVEDVCRLMRAMLSEMKTDRAELAGYRSANNVASTLALPQEAWLVCGNDLYTSEGEAREAAYAVLRIELDNLPRDQENARDWIITILHSGSNVGEPTYNGRIRAIELFNRLFPHRAIRVEKLELKVQFKEQT